MFHITINLSADGRTLPIDELALRAFVSGHEEALGYAAVLLANRNGARLMNEIREGFDQPGPLSSCIRRMLLEMRGILFLDYNNGDACEHWASSTVLDPEDPIVHELCLLADGFDDALRCAGILTSSNEQPD